MLENCLLCACQALCSSLTNIVLASSRVALNLWAKSFGAYSRFSVNNSDIMSHKSRVCTDELMRPSKSRKRVGWGVARCILSEGRFQMPAMCTRRCDIAFSNISPPYILPLKLMLSTHIPQHLYSSVDQLHMLELFAFDCNVSGAVELLSVCGFYDQYYQSNVDDLQMTLLHPRS